MTLLPVRFDAEAVPAWLAQQASLLEPESIELEVTPTTLLEPAGLALLASLVASRTAAGKETRWLGTAPDRSPLRDLTPITDLRVARRVAEAMADSLERGLPNAATSVVRAARFVLEELGANIVQHSQRPTTGFGMLATWPERGQGTFQVAFADAGVGFLGSLSRNAELATRIHDDGEAIQLAVERGLSGVRSNMGMGLGLLNDIADRLGADVWILSGDALWHRRTVAGLRAATVRAVPRHRGAWICLEGPAFPR